LGEHGFFTLRYTAKFQNFACSPIIRAVLGPIPFQIESNRSAVAGSQTTQQRAQNKPPNTGVAWSLHAKIDCQVLKFRPFTYNQDSIGTNTLPNRVQPKRRCRLTNYSIVCSKRAPKRWGSMAPLCPDRLPSSKISPVHL